MSKSKLEATRANQARKAARSGRVPPGTTVSKRRGRMPFLIGGAVVVVVAVAVAAFLALRGSSGTNTAVKWDQLQGMQTGGPPYTPGLDQLAQRLQVMGIPPANGMNEGQLVHIHQHLDMWVDGKKVTVPALIGIDQLQGFLAALHTHDTSGIMHFESFTNRPYTLAEFFGVWGLKLTQDCLGTLCANGDKKVRVYVDGKPVTGDPGLLKLTPHQEFVVTYGTKAQLPKKIPARYKFPAGV
jgi:hypothetical protein